MIVVTGAAGFIGSNVIADLESCEIGPIVAVDWFGKGEKWRNLLKRSIAAFIEPEKLMDFLAANGTSPKVIFHMGAIMKIAIMKKIRSAGMKYEFATLEKGIENYLDSYLLREG